MKPEDFRADAKRPLTGEEYLKSLQDGREIYIYGERVKDVTTHPAFRNAAASVGQLYDALHKPEMQDKLCWGTDTGSGAAVPRAQQPAGEQHEAVAQIHIAVDGGRDLNDAGSHIDKGGHQSTEN